MDVAPTVGRTGEEGGLASRTASAAELAPSLGGAGLAHVIGPLLGALAEIGEFDATYVTAIDWEHRELHVLHAFNTASVEVPAGMRVECRQDLAEQAFLGVTRSNDLPTAQPDSEVARSLGLSRYASVPIVKTDHRLFGTLCGASRMRRDVADETISVMEHFSRLIVDQMARDETRRTEQRAGLAEKQLRERAGFLAQAEHMLKTPLTVVSGLASTLEHAGSTMTEADRSRAISSVRKNAGLLTAQVNRLLEESMAEVRARDLHPAVLDLRDAVVATVDAFREAAPDHHLRVTSTGAVWAFVDPGVLHQVVAHLLDNAVKYSPPSTTIEVSVRRSASRAQVDVRDEGVGIPTDIDVFEAFQRGGDPMVTTSSGVGLGLHIVRNLTRAMDGDVTAARNDGDGSTFTLRLPLVPTPETDSVPGDRAEPRTTSPGAVIGLDQ